MTCATRRSNGAIPVGGLAAAKEPGLMHIQGGQVRPGSGALVFMLDLHQGPGPGRLRRVAAAARLNARLLIGRDHEVVSGQGALLPDALVEIEDPPGLGRKLRIARKDPAPVEPRPNRVVVQPAPDRAAADGCYQPGPLGFGGQLAHAPPGQRALGAGRQFTREGFDGDDDFWGEKPGDVPSVIDPPARGAVLQKSVFARPRPLPAGSASGGRSPHWTSPRPPAGSSWRGAPRNTGACIVPPGRSTSVLRRPTAQSDRGSAEASFTVPLRLEYGAIFWRSVQEENVSVFMKRCTKLAVVRLCRPALANQTWRGV